MLFNGPAVRMALFCLKVVLFNSSCWIFTNAPIGIPKNNTIPVDSTLVLYTRATTPCPAS